jgi:hypothetical protein
MLPNWPIARWWAAVALSLVAGCSSSASDELPPTCSLHCEAATAVRAVRETMKLVFNLSLQGNPVGEQDETVACPDGGSAHLTGQASADSERGTTKVGLAYDFQDCRYEQLSSHPSSSYALSITGRVQQSGVLAGPAQTTTALVLESEILTLQGTLYDPPLEYHAEECVLSVIQEGDRVSGTLCDLVVSVDL